MVTAACVRMTLISILNIGCPLIWYCYVVCKLNM